MGILNSLKANKEIKNQNIANYNEFIQKCANNNRIFQIQHFEDYISIPSLFNLKTIVLAKIFCEKYDTDSFYYQVNNSCYEFNILLFDSMGNKYSLYDNNKYYKPCGNGLIKTICSPIDCKELVRVLFRIVPFIIVSANSDYTNEDWIRKIQKWNYGSNYDCDTAYKGKTYFFAAGVENQDSKIKNENDIYIRNDEIFKLSDNALLYFLRIINYWEDNNMSEIIGDYNLWLTKKNYIVNYKESVLAEIGKRKLISANTDYGRQGEENVEYALKWLPKGYTLIQKNDGIYLRCFDVSEEKQEIDHIVVGENGVFVIETKYFKGNIIVDSYGNWERECDGKIEGLKNPVQQIDRHHKVISAILRDIVDENDIHDIICLAYDSCTVKGIDNSPIQIVKVDLIARNIINTESTKKYSKAEISKIVDEINKSRITK